MKLLSEACCADFCYLRMREAWSEEVDGCAPKPFPCHYSTRFLCWRTSCFFIKWVGVLMCTFASYPVPTHTILCCYVMCDAIPCHMVLSFALLQVHRYGGSSLSGARMRLCIRTGPHTKNTCANQTRRGTLVIEKLSYQVAEAAAVLNVSTHGALNYNASS